MTMMTKKQIAMFYGSEVAHFASLALSLPLDKDHPRYKLAQTVSLCAKPYTDLIVDTDAIDEDLLFIHHNSFTLTFGIYLKDMTLSITDTVKDENLEVLPFTFQTLLEKLKQYHGNAQ